MKKQYENMTDEDKIAYNKKLIQKYPFLLPRNRWTGEVSDDYDFSYTELDDMDTGWRIAFGEQMCEEIAEALKKDNYLNEYRIAQLKEKFGSMRIYDFGASKEVHDIIDKYEVISMRICIGCGSPATRISKGWISPWCDKCAEERKLNCWSIDEYYDDFGDEDGEE